MSSFLLRDPKGCCCYRINSLCTHNFLFYLRDLIRYKLRYICMSNQCSCRCSDQ